MAKLEVVAGSLAGAVVELDPQTPCEVGSSRKCRLCVRDKGVSFAHASIAFQDGAFVVIDGRSKGTYLNGTKLERGVPAVLSSGDQIRFGDETEVRFLISVAPVVEPEPAPGPIAAEAEESAEVAALKEELRRTTGRLKKQLEESEENVRLREAATQDLGAKLGEVVEALQATEEELERERAHSERLEQELGELHAELERLQREKAELEARLSAS